ncbi:MAG: hypothetical protein R2882_11375 [Gemmatimonadales bacterium]
MMLLVMSLFIGPRMLRNDLRQDLLRLEPAQDLPAVGVAIVLGEIASPAGLLTVVQVGLLAVLPFAAPRPVEWAVTSVGWASLALLPLVLFAVNAMNVTIRTPRAAVPRVGSIGTRRAGMEAMGLSIIVMIGFVLALVVAPIPPALEVWVVATVGVRDRRRSVAPSRWYLERCCCWWKRSGWWDGWAAPSSDSNRPS